MRVITLWRTVTSEVLPSTAQQSTPACESLHHQHEALHHQRPYQPTAAAAASLDDIATFVAPSASAPTASAVAGALHVAPTVPAAASATTACRQHFTIPRLPPLIFMLQVLYQVSAAGPS